MGFSELLRQKEIERLPRLFVAQPANCAPLHETFQNGSDELVSINARPTIAEGTSIARPIRFREVLEAVRRSCGSTVALSEDEIHEAHIELARMGLYAEPTSASAAAALTQLVAAGFIKPEQTTVVLSTKAD